MLESTAKSADNRAPANAGLAAFEVAVAQQRVFEENLRQAVERRKQEIAEAERLAAEARARQEARRTNSDSEIDAAVVKAVEKIEKSGVDDSANPPSSTTASPSSSSTNRGEALDIRV